MPAGSATISVGSIATITGVGAGDFAAFIPGLQAYFDMVNAEGGVDGRRIVLAHDLDDGGSPSTFSLLAHTLIEQDHVFAVFVSTFWFTPDLFSSTSTPTYGYNVSGNWAGPDNLFAAGGSTQDYHALAPPVAYFVHRAHASSVALISYGQGIPASYPACHTLGQDLTAAGIDVNYEDLDASLGGDFTSAAQQIAAHHSQFLVSCIEDSDDVNLSRDLQQYGVSIGQLWLNGYDQTLLDQYRSLMRNVYIDANGFVPFFAPTTFPGVYPGMEQYLAAMRRYEPTYVTNQLSMQGWQSAALLVEGLRQAGPNPTQQRVIAQTNRLVGFTAGGVSAPVNWSTAHTVSTFPICPSFVQVKGTTFVPVTASGHQVFICFGDHTNLKDPVPVPPPPGTPGT
ncbi:MAG TPA: ABC transporter substrate-binding protein [Acidimicrobiales bacterium]|nr:ABC transporter substrate-binding protein [Acidimicrobiales bacterium]